MPEADPASNMLFRPLSEPAPLDLFCRRLLAKGARRRRCQISVEMAGSRSNLAPAIPPDLLGDQCTGEVELRSNRHLWKIYLIRRRKDGRPYVGVTRRTVSARVAMHDHMARLRPQLGGAGSLAEAIREAYTSGLSFNEAFEVKPLAETDNADEARRLEREWVERLGSQRPHGFNLMPAGSSLGGPANAEPVVVSHPTRGRIGYRSIMEAVADVNRERAERGAPPLQLGTVYARRAMGWPIDQALELDPHTDGRGERAPFRWRGRVYNTLHELAAAEGLKIDTLRSRLHRAGQAGCGPEYDLSQDRRHTGPMPSERTEGRRLPRLILPHPFDEAAAPLDVRSCAALTGIPKATLAHRHRRLRDQGSDPRLLSRNEVLQVLLQPVDRRVVISLDLPDGSTVTGGVREVIREVLGHPRLRWSRVEPWLGASAIRARLRRLSGWPTSLDAAGVRWAFGFGSPGGGDPDKASSG